MATTSDTEGRMRVMREAVGRHTRDFPLHAPDESVKLPEKDVVLATGTTGVVGARILHELMHDDSVARIYAVNRRHKGQMDTLLERQKIAFAKQDLPSDYLQSEKVILVEANMDEDGLGLSPALLGEVRESVTHIVHNAWRVDFGLPLASFEPNIRSVRCIVDLALSSHLPTPARILFVSSIAAVWLANTSPHASVPEEPAPPDFALINGYGQSKWVAEMILQQSPLQSTIVRIGQVCGAIGSNGSAYWNTVEWFPRVVKSSVTLGCFPSGNARISWIPVDAVARFLVRARSTSSGFLHLVHPRPASWAVLARTISVALGLHLVPYIEWRAKLEGATRGSKANTNRGRLPVAKILPLLPPMLSSRDLGAGEAMDLPNLDMTAASRLLALDENLLGLEQVDERDVQAWVQAWKESGFLYPPKL
ncbi:male sterility protein-domain-containing protein [Vararia minispora EC-137]|uniref:Male sterility protein-domain-containing protein n=1 Tax=Vararia minispora EC-137 TaxID=1314806 RepID=A0ACB8Q817_9AGAM|nr:male sterility protein-domain-containing protein [Vararia minispora EC-137]